VLIRTLWQYFAPESERPYARSSARTRRSLDAAALEDRVLFSAAPVGAALEGGLDVDAGIAADALADDGIGVDLGTMYRLDPSEAIWAETKHFEPEQAAADDATSDVRHELVFVDTSARNYQQLLDDLWSHDDPQRQLDVVLISPGEGGVEQITAALAHREEVNAIHILSHGTDDAIKLGNRWLNADNVDSFAEQLTSWGESISEDADLLIYGCNLATGEAGKSLVQMLSQWCDCDVAASTDDTGHERLGGDWQLEFAVGGIDAESALSVDAQQNWLNLLALETVRDDFDTASYANNNGSANWVGSWVETDAGGGGATGGDVFVTTNLHLQSTNLGDGLYREANLAAASAATLTFDIQNGISDDDVIRLEVSHSGGTNWNTLRDYSSSNFGFSNESFDITAFTAPETQIRFRYVSVDEGDAFQVDNLQVEYTTGIAPAVADALWLSSAAVQIPSISKLEMCYSESKTTIPPVVRRWKTMICCTFDRLPPAITVQAPFRSCSTIWRTTIFGPLRW
jgi:hypothetical protein